MTAAGSYYLNNLSPEGLAQYVQPQMPQSPTGCGPFSLAMALNVRQGRPTFAGGWMENYFTKHAIKPKGFGVPAPLYRRGVNLLLRGLAKVEYHRDWTVDDLIASLKAGNYNIVTISWQSNAEILNALKEIVTRRDLNHNGRIDWLTVGHYMLLAGYDAALDELVFLDPGKFPGDTSLTRFARPNFETYWAKKPNLFIPSRSVTVIKFTA